MIRIQLDLEPNRQRLYTDALTRLRGVEIAAGADGKDADAWISGDPRHAAPSSQPGLLDRPERVSAEQLQALADSGTRLMPAHAWRFQPVMQPIRESVASGQLGPPGLLRMHHWTPAPASTRADWLMFAQIDLARWLFGADPNAAHALSDRDYLQVHLGFPNGGMAVLDAAVNRPGPDPYHSLHLIGSDGAAYADDHHNAHLVLGPDSARAWPHPHDECPGVTAMLGEFLHGVSRHEPWGVNMDDTIRARRILEEVTRA